ncbi:hypothetical protein [Streptomyces sp. NPDC090445]|uniref:hypothetical protein n=1 Tax=Streptomyces sp. NPDC090445 TaxID=3365963 RepID=UPI003823ABC4
MSGDRHGLCGVGRGRCGRGLGGSGRERASLLRAWLRAQFEELGFAVEAGDLAMHVLAA